MLELGKILYYSSLGNFIPPDHYYFVAPKGVNRNFQALLDKPSELQAQLIGNWTKFCGEKIVKGEHISLDGKLLACLESYDFSRVSRIALEELLVDTCIRPVLAKWFGLDPGSPPKGIVPVEVQATELPYIRQLLSAYSQRDGQEYTDHSEFLVRAQHGPHLDRQRLRFYDADAFKRFYRDNTSAEILETFEGDVFHGVIDVWEAEHIDSLSCIETVMSHAASVAVSGPLALHARVPVKQGVCHHFVNESRLKWCR